MTEDKRPDPKPRKNPILWQAYLHWYELMEMRKRHNLRISSIEAGKSNLDGQFEKDVLDHMSMDALLENAKKTMINYGTMVGPIWDWVVGMKGLGAGGLAAQLLAQIDDIARFDSVSKLWRVCGYGIYLYWVKDGKVMAPKDGWKWKKSGDGSRERFWVVTEPLPGWELKPMIDRNMEGWHSPFNRKLKGVLFNVADQFIRHQVSPYVDIYYAEKERQKSLHPDPVKANGKKNYTKGHIHNRARRKMIKAFLRDLWLIWRELEDLPVTEAYSQ